MGKSRRIRYALLGLTLVVAGGTIAFHLIERMSVFDSLYYMVITLTTVGTGDHYPVTPEGKLAAMLTIVAGVVLVGLLVGSLTEMLVEIQVRQILGRRRLEKQISGLRDHFIVCGFGRIGSIVCRELHQDGVPFVVIEIQEDLLTRADEEGYLYLQEDATEDSALNRAGIQKAKGLVAVLGKDADNVYITMSARDLNRKLHIVARGEDERTARKLARAGASRVVSPHEIGGQRMAHAILRPNVIDFIEATTRAGTEINMEEIPVRASSQVAGKTLMESGIRQEFGVIIVAIRKPDGRMTFNPDSKSEIEPEDVLITMGPEKDQARLAVACG
ncbi:MAG: potassium channel family protein [Planctomycetota bacterium]|jgi:voltage-gated potassium channel